MLAIAASCSVVHKNSFLLLRSGRSVAKSSVIVLLTNPTKDRNLFRVVGMGKCDMAAVVEGSS